MLPDQAAKAQVIIAKLDQPHRYDFALQCKCGFQSHGYKNEDATRGDEAELARGAARTHLVNRHGAKVEEADQRIKVTPFTTAGGMGFDQLELQMQKWIAEHPEVPVVDTPTLSAADTADQVEWDKKYPTQEEQEKAKLAAGTKQATSNAGTIPPKPPAPVLMPPAKPTASQPQKPATATPPAKPEVQTGGVKK